jgi:hypothetical protein
VGRIVSVAGLFCQRCLYLHGYIEDPGVSGHTSALPNQDMLDQDNRMCVYDRANVGLSDRVKGPLDGESSVADRHERGAGRACGVGAGAGARGRPAGHSADVPGVFKPPSRPEMAAAILRLQREFVSHFSPGRLVRLDVPHDMEPAIPERIAQEVSV